LYTYLRGNT